MWPILLILALVPMIFMLSDSVYDLFPGLGDLLPDRDAKQEIIETQPEHSPARNAGGQPGTWYVSDTEGGYVAWAISQDGTYRLAVGCYPDTPATIQATHLSGEQLPDGMALNYTYGVLPLTAGAYTGDELVAATAQLKDVYLQTESGEVQAQFTIPGHESNAIARQIRDVCTQTAAAQ